MVVHTVKQVVVRNWVEKTEAASHTSPTRGPDGSWRRALAPMLALQREGTAGAAASCAGTSWGRASATGSSILDVQEQAA